MGTRAASCCLASLLLMHAVAAEATATWPWSKKCGCVAVPKAAFYDAPGPWCPPAVPLAYAPPVYTAQPVYAAPPVYSAPPVYAEPPAIYSPPVIEEPLPGMWEGRPLEGGSGFGAPGGYRSFGGAAAARQSATALLVLHNVPYDVEIHINGNRTTTTSDTEKRRVYVLTGLSSEETLYYEIKAYWPKRLPQPIVRYVEVEPRAARRTYQVAYVDDEFKSVEKVSKKKGRKAELTKALRELTEMMEERRYRSAIEEQTSDGGEFGPSPFADGGQEGEDMPPPGDGAHVPAGPVDHSSQQTAKALQEIKAQLHHLPEKIAEALKSDGVIKPAVKAGAAVVTPPPLTTQTFELLSPPTILLQVRYATDGRAAQIDFKEPLKLPRFLDIKEKTGTLVDRKIVDAKLRYNFVLQKDDDSEITGSGFEVEDPVTPLEFERSRCHPGFYSTTPGSASELLKQRLSQVLDKDKQPDKAVAALKFVSGGRVFDVGELTFQLEELTD